MRHKCFALTCALVACAFLTGGSATSSLARTGQEKDKATQGGQDAKDKDAKDKDKAATANLSDGERKAATKINEAKDPSAKLTAATDFVKKYPKSTLRPKIADHVAGHLSNVQDSAQKLKLAETYLTVFSEPGEAELVTPYLVEGYLTANRLDDAFRIGGPWLEKNPNEVDVLRRLAILGATEAFRENKKYAQQSQQYGVKAIELLENDTKVAGFDDAQWTEYKTRWLPVLYREMGVLALVLDNKSDALIRLENAVALKTTDPTVYAILGNLKNDDYLFMAKQYNVLPAGAEKEAALKKAQAQMDKVIELYAQAIGTSGERPEYKPVRDQLMPALEDYYKSRHNGSTDGLRQLIDKYKQTAAK